MPQGVAEVDEGPWERVTKSPRHPPKLGRGAQSQGPDRHRRAPDLIALGRRRPAGGAQTAANQKAQPQHHHKEQQQPQSFATDINASGSSSTSSELGVSNGSSSTSLSSPSS
eukprot:scaffold57940_cov24-Prasinocladus_malaysianus.AAC.1